jgi:UDP-N-acetylglucosamine--N-acetylmuramyl-(pentapeptide) pyrophosphoryl-undecaprenol N-acetylglucosamine transferase
MANRKLASLVDKICLSLPGSENYFPKEKVEFTGNPVRQNILDSVDSAAGASQDKLTIAVLGGSQGARGVNDLVIEAFCGRTAADLVDVKLIHQTGQADYERVAAAYDVRRKGVEVAPFFEDMGAVYSRADLLVSRAGATTLTEAAVLGKPAILIPYPYAADNHQQKNGDYYVRGGGALQFAEKEFSGGALAAEIIRLAEDRSELARMKGAMKKLGCPQAAERIVDICLAAARPKR